MHSVVFVHSVLYFNHNFTHGMLLQASYLYTRNTVLSIKTNILHSFLHTYINSVIKKVCLFLQMTSNRQYYYLLILHQISREKSQKRIQNDKKCSCLSVKTILTKHEIKVDKHFVYILLHVTTPVNTLILEIELALHNLKIIFFSKFVSQLIREKSNSIR